MTYQSKTIDGISSGPFFRFASLARLRERRSARSWRSRAPHHARRESHMTRFQSWWRVLAVPAAFTLATLLLPLTPAAAQTGSIAGKVVDEAGAPVAGAQVFVEKTTLGGNSKADGTYLVGAVPARTQSVRVRMIGYRSQVASVTVGSGERATHDFRLAADPLNLEAVVVTGTETPRTKLETNNATTVLSAADITQAAPRSTTEALRYVGIYAGRELGRGS